MSLWQSWCMLCGWFAAIAYAALALFAAYSFIAPKLCRPKRNAFRACPTCRNEHDSPLYDPCRDCIRGQSRWTPKL